MTSNRNTKAPIKRALILVTILAGTAWTGSAYADDATKIAVPNEAAPVQTANTVNSDQRFDLHAYGDRFKLAIKAIEQAANKPDWGWACDEDVDQVVASND